MEYTDPNPQNNYYEEEEIDWKPYVKKLLRNWKFVFKLGCLGVVLGLIFALSAVKTYTASAVLAPELTKKSSSSISSLASLAGVNLNNVNVTDAMYPDLYPEIVGSVPFVVELLKMPVSFEDGKETIETDLYTYLDEYQKGTWYGAVMGAPMKALSWTIGLISSKDEEEENKGVSSINPEHLSFKQETIVKSLLENTSVTVDKKTAVISLSAKLQNPVLAKQLCDQIVEKLTDYIVQYRTEKARKDVEYYQMLTDEARADYYAAQKKYAEYSDANQGVTRNSYLIERERLQNEASLAFQLYNQTAQQLQAAEATVQQETPVSVTIKPSTVPLKGEPSRAKILVMWTFLLGAGACAWVLFGDMAKDFIAELKEDDEATPDKA